MIAMPACYPPHLTRPALLKITKMHTFDMTDLTTGRHGSMTASVANGFGHILYNPNSTTCQAAPYAFPARTA
jgi:hypothetical protein